MIQYVAWIYLVAPKASEEIVLTCLHAEHIHAPQLDYSKPPPPPFHCRSSAVLSITQNKVGLSEGPMRAKRVGLRDRASGQKHKARMSAYPTQQSVQ